MSRFEHTELNQKFETSIRKVKLDKMLKPKERNEDCKSRYISSHTTIFLRGFRVEEGSREFSVLVDGVYILELREVVKLHAV